MNSYIFGGNEQSTHKYVSELLGKETIDTNTYGKSAGHSSSYSTNYQGTGRELMTPDEVRMLDNSKAILLIRGEKPIIDDKYDILKHPNLKYTADGNSKIYEHGGTRKATASLLKLKRIDTKDIKNVKEMKLTNNYELLSEEEIENYYLREDLENEREREKEN